MVFRKLDSRTAIFILAVAVSLTSCTQTMREDLFFALNAFGLLYTPEYRLNLELDRQDAEKPFSFAEYCSEKYDSVVFLSPYSNVVDSAFANLRMSYTLREKCDDNTMFDSFSTILFISNGKVKAYSEAAITDADFLLNGNADNPRFYPFEQMFIMDKDRNVHLYSE